MKFRSLTFLVFALFTLNLNAQIVVDFEDTTLNDTSFMAGGVEWKMTGDFLISEFDDFHCGMGAGTNRYIDTGYSVGENGSEGILGSISPINPDVLFEMSVDHCVWPGSHDGEQLSLGTFRFMGFKSDGSTIQEDFDLQSTSFNEMQSIAFSAAIWEDVELSSLQIEIIGTTDSTDYLAIDNLAFELIYIPTNVQSIEETNIKLFPNPTSGLLSLQNINADQIDVYDNLGQMVKTETTP